MIHTSDRRDNAAGKEAVMRVFNDPDTPNPEVHLLSNGQYHVMVSNAGGGYSHWNDLSLTRWREDSTCDNWGTFCYIRDTVSGQFWSTTYQPTLRRPEEYGAIFAEAKVEFRRHDYDIDTYSELVVSPEDNIELRRVRLTNRSSTRRTIDVTSYAEVVLASSATDAQHPAFSNLFVETEIISNSNAILCTRRPQSPEEKSPWLFHLMVKHEGRVDQVSYETDRMQFVGRGRTVANPLAMEQNVPLSGTQGSVLDPIVSIRYRLIIEPEESATINIITGIGETRERALELIEKYQDHDMPARVFELALTHSQVMLRQLNATEYDAQLYGRIANSIIYANPHMRADASVLIKNRRGQSALWSYAISGDLPIVLLQIKHPENIELVRQLLQAHAYWRLKGLKVDLMILNEDTGKVLHDQIMALIADSTDTNLIDKPGGIFIRSIEPILVEDRILLQSVARAVITDSQGSLEQQLSRRVIAPEQVPQLKPVQSYCSEPIVEPAPRNLILFNGLGGFTPDGCEYVITTRTGKPTPAPWVNVLANPYFGSVISESGNAYSWAENSHEFRLTPWNNDPVTDLSGEVFYICDQECGYFWSPSPLPTSGTNPYVSRHGFGYSVFEHIEGGIISELTVHVALDAPIKFSGLKIRNVSGRPRKLSVTGYVEWVLGDLRPKTAMQIVTQIDPKSGAIFAQNSYNTEFQDRVSFFDVDDLTRTFTCDRGEFLGRNGTLRNPLAMSMSYLSGKVGAALDPCSAIQIQLELADGQEREIIFRLGSGRDANDASTLVHRFRGPQARHDSYEKVSKYWKHTLGAVNVQTPDDSLNILANGWLLYEDIACRVWGRSGYYQSSGAFGFRDQIQDTMALVHAEPRLLREQLLLCASRQFIEGDVQHWWHPPSGRGIRSHCSDDFLWLPLATCRYVSCTGDTGVLDEQIHYLEGPSVKPEEASYYGVPSISQQSDTLYEHCKRALVRGLRFGEHGLPLIGCGDWNDGMNLVGIKGKGESVWVGFFLYDILRQFQNIARMRGDQQFTNICEQQAGELRRNIDMNGWDGEWYRRAYFDDGTPLGAASNVECKIDSIAQSWSVLSGAGDATHSRQAMNSLYSHLVHRDTAIIQLLNPPFDKSDLNPGYIKGYVPGVRENGGQYTHAAVWAAMAFAAMGDRDRAWELFTILNPINHARTPEGVAIYKVEPYVVAGDVYACPPHTGHGGWTWYTGSAGWLYRLIVESLLGLKLEANKLCFHPCLPKDWKEFKIHYRYRETVYHITVNQTDEASSVIVDGASMLDAAILMIDDRQEHFVEVNIPEECA